MDPIEKENGWRRTIRKGVQNGEHDIQQAWLLTWASLTIRGGGRAALHGTDARSRVGTMSGSSTVVLSERKQKKGVGIDLGMGR